MVAGIIGVLTLGMVAVIVSQLARSGSQGPALVTSLFSGTANVYSALMK